MVKLRALHIDAICVDVVNVSPSDCANRLNDVISILSQLRDNKRIVEVYLLDLVTTQRKLDLAKRFIERKNQQG